VRHTIVREGNKGYAFAEPKTRSSRRVIPMPAAVVDALRGQRIRARELQLLAIDWPDLDLVFPSHIGTPIRETKYIEVSMTPSNVLACGAAASTIFVTPTRPAFSR
jgi:integrase